MKKTVFGLSDSFTKFTSSVGKGQSSHLANIPSLTVYHRVICCHIRLRIPSEKANDSKAQQTSACHVRIPYFHPGLSLTTPRYGVAAGGEAFASSVTSAMEGVVVSRQ